MKSSGTPAPAAFGLWMFIVLNHIAILFVCVFPDWKHSSWQISNGLIGRVATFSGIWWNCFSPKWGLFVCDNHGQVPVYSKRKLLVTQLTSEFLCYVTEQHQRRLPVLC